MPAVKPHTSIERTRNAGPIQPLGWRTHTRLAGSTSSPTGTRSTRATSPGCIGATGCGARHQASTGVTTNRLTGIHSCGNCARTSTLDESSPTSSAASRSAVSAGSRSFGSAAPPGNAGCPAWLRMSAARCRSNTSGPWPSLSASRISTALGRPPSGGTASGLNWCRRVSATRSSSGSHHSGRSLMYRPRGAYRPTARSPPRRAPCRCRHTAARRRHRRTV